MKLDKVLAASLFALFLTGKEAYAQQDALIPDEGVLDETELDIEAPPVLGESETRGGGTTGGAYLDRFFDENGNLKPEIQDLCNSWYITQNREKNSIDLNTGNSRDILDEVTGGAEPPKTWDQATEDLPKFTVNGEEIGEDDIRNAAKSLSDATGWSAQDVNNAIDENQGRLADLWGNQ